LRIAQVAPLWTRIPPTTYGGIELLMKLLIDELVARGHEVTLFASADCQTSGRLVPVCEANLTEMTSRGEMYMFEYYASSAIAQVLRRAGEFDIVHYHLSTAWLPLAATIATPGLFTMHTCPHLDDEFVMREWPNVAVAGISKAQMHGASVKLGREFPIVYNGCDFRAYEPGYAPGQYLAFLGRLSPEKNPLGAIRIARQVEMPLVIAGQPQNANERAYFHAEIEPLVDGERVRWIGPVNHPQKNELLRHAAALLFPIQWDEPFGLVMIEAMACGTPVVAHRRGSVEEVVDQGVTGFHSVAVDGLAEFVEPALRLDRRAVREHALRRFGYRTMVDRYVNLYRSLAKPGMLRRKAERK
ncbi:MAG TPA: glycosyltransferase family 4 protein, partial [Chthoniobacteraceae bacterium]|nr:glycosyltransferase family 4 protein [Chthoniobacteraceae bacterium]